MPTKEPYESDTIRQYSDAPAPHYFRIILFGLILITLISVVALLILFSLSPAEKPIDVNIKTPKATESPVQRIIKPAPPPPTPPQVRNTLITNNSALKPKSNKNANDQ